MRITLTTKQFYPALGGSIRYADLLATEFRRQRHSVTVVTRTASAAPDHFFYTVCRRPNARELFRIASQTDVLFQVEASWQDAWPFLILGKPWFTSIHRGYVPAGKSWLARIRLFAEQMAYRCSQCISVSNYARESWKLTATVIPNPFESNLFFPPAELSVRNVDVIYVGRLTEDKGCLVLLEALRRLGRRNIPIKACFVGEGLARETLERHRELGSVELELWGKRNPKEIAELMRASKVLVYPTTTRWLDASPLSLPEALACGCRIVASNWSGIPETVGGFACLVPPDDADALADAIGQELVGKVRRVDGTALDAFLATRQIERIAIAYLALFERGK